MNLKKNIDTFKTYVAIFNFILLLVLIITIITMIIFAVRKNEED